MTKTTRVGSFIFAIAMIAFGIQNFVYSDFTFGLLPIPVSFPARQIFVYVVGLVMIGAGVSIIINKRARPFVLALAAIWLLAVIFLHINQIRTGGRFDADWTTAFETLAIGGASLVLAGVLSVERPNPQRVDTVLEKLVTVGRLLFALSLPVFGIQHFMYTSTIASVIPSWIPFSRQFWADFTGFAHVAGGVSMGNNILARLGATLTSVMFGSWVLILHIPRVIDNPGIRTEWTSAIIALAMCGGALIIAGTLPQENWLKWFSFLRKSEAPNQVVSVSPQ